MVIMQQTTVACKEFNFFFFFKKETGMAVSKICKMFPVV